MANQMIALGVRGPQLPDLGAAAARFSNMMANMATMRERQGVAERAAQFRQLVSSEGFDPGNPEHIRAAAALDPAGAAAISREFTDRRKSDQDYELANYVRYRNLYPTVTDEQGHQAWLRGLERMSPETAEYIRQTAPNYSLENKVRVLATADQMLGLMASQRQSEIAYGRNGEILIVNYGGIAEGQGTFNSPQMRRVPGNRPAPAAGTPAAETVGPARDGMGPQELIAADIPAENVPTGNPTVPPTPALTPASAGGGVGGVQPLDMRTAPQIIQNAIQNRVIDEMHVQQLRAVFQQDPATAAQNERALAEWMRQHQIRIQPTGEAPIQPGMRSAEYRPGMGPTPQFRQVQEVVGPGGFTYEPTGEVAVGRDPSVSPMPGSSIVPLDRLEAEARVRREPAGEAAARAAAVEEARLAQGNLGVGYRLRPDGTAEFIPGGPADPARPSAPRPMSDSTAKQLEDQVELTLGMQRHLNNFSPYFAGNPLTGGLESSIQGAFSSFGTPGQRAWWADFQATDNLIRNSLFGATLTQNEKVAYDRTTVNPSMDPAEVRRNLEQRAEILLDALRRRTNYLRASGYRPEQIDASLGDALPLVSPQQPAAPAAPADAAAGGATTLPQARGVQADPGVDAEGVVDVARGGSRVVPALYGLGDEIASIIQQGGTREQAVGHYQTRMRDAGVQPSPGHVSDIDYLVAQHKVDPRPVKGLMTGWENFHMVETPDEGGSLLGTIADSPVGAAVIGAAQGLSAGNLGNIAGPEGQSVVDYSRAERPISTFIGDAAGTIGALSAGGGIANMAARGTGALARGGRAMNAMSGLGLDTTYGAIRGASEAAPGEGLSGALLGATLAGAGNRVGAGAANVTGRVVRGITDPGTRYLADRGINMSLGQLLGTRSATGRVINRLENAPILRDGLLARRGESVGDYARAQLAENLAPIGYTPPRGSLSQDMPFSQDMLADAQRAIDTAYSDALTGASVTPDAQFTNDITRILNKGANVTDMGPKFLNLINARIGTLFDTPTGTLDAPQIQAALSRTREIASSFRRDGDPVAPLVAEAADDFNAALVDLIERQSPGVVPKLRAANEAYRGLVPIESAAINAINRGGVFTPGEYGAAAVRNTVNFGGRGAAARGDIPGADLQRYAQSIMPNSAAPGARSGLAALVLPTALGGAAVGGGTLTDYPLTSAGLGTLALLSTRGGSGLVQRNLMAGARRQGVGNAILDLQRGAARGGATGAAITTHRLTDDQVFLGYQTGPNGEAIPIYGRAGGL